MLFGQNINISVGKIEYFASSRIATIASIAGGVTGGAILVLLLLVMFSAILYCYLSSISKYKRELEQAQQPVYV